MYTQTEMSKQQVVVLQLVTHWNIVISFTSLVAMVATRFQDITRRVKTKEKKTTVLISNHFISDILTCCIVTQGIYIVRFPNFTMCMPTYLTIYSGYQFHS